GAAVSSANAGAAPSARATRKARAEKPRILFMMLLLPGNSWFSTAGDELVARGAAAVRARPADALVDAAAVAVAEPLLRIRQELRGPAFGLRRADLALGGRGGVGKAQTAGDRERGGADCGQGLRSRLLGGGWGCAQEGPEEQGGEQETENLESGHDVLLGSQQQVMKWTHRPPPQSASVVQVAPQPQTQ